MSGLPSDPVSIIPSQNNAPHNRTREGLSPYDLRIAYELTAAIGEHYEPKPGLVDMHAWAETEWDRIHGSTLNVALINGFVDPGHARHLAVGRRAMDFLARCVEHEEEIQTMFRAKAHNARRRR